MELSLKRSYENKKVLVTGHTGFKGSWLSQWLLNLGAKVYGVSKDIPTKPSIFEELNLHKKLNHQILDIRDYRKFEQHIKKIKPDIIFHLAAQSIVNESYNNPVETIETNLMGTVNLLEAVRQLNLKTSIILVSTDKCYENMEWLYGYRENDKMGGYDPYSASKGAMEIIVSSYKRSFFDPMNYDTHGVILGTVRAGNVIGGGDWATDRLIPDCIRSLVSEKNIELRNPSSVRPWQHVLEPLGGYLLLGSKMVNSQTKNDIVKFSDSFNFGPLISSNRTVRALANLFLENWESSKKIVTTEAEFHEANLLNLSITKAYHVLGWHPVWNFKTTVSKTSEWYKTFVYEPGTIIDLTNEQIIQYTKEWRNLEL